MESELVTARWAGEGADPVSSSHMKIFGCQWACCCCTLTGCMIYLLVIKKNAVFRLTKTTTLFGADQSKPALSTELSIYAVWVEH